MNTKLLTPAQRRVYDTLREPGGVIYRSGLQDWCASTRTEGFAVNRATINALRCAGLLQRRESGRGWVLAAAAAEKGGGA